MGANAKDKAFPQPETSQARALPFCGKKVQVLTENLCFFSGYKLKLQFDLKGLFQPKDSMISAPNLNSVQAVLSSTSTGKTCFKENSVDANGKLRIKKVVPFPTSSVLKKHCGVF